VKSPALSRRTASENRSRDSNLQLRLLRIAVLLMMFHPALLLTIEFVMYGVRGYDLSPARTIGSSITLVADGMVFHWISRYSAVAWTMLATQAACTILYALMLWPFGHPGLLSGLLLISPFCLIALWSVRSVYRLRKRHLYCCVVSIVITSLVIYIDGRYYPSKSIDIFLANPDVELLLPQWQMILLKSRFAFTLEYILLLAWGCYSAIIAVAWAVERHWPCRVEAS
jgi:hypothetical protein